MLVIEGHTAVGLFMVMSGFIFSYGASNSAIDYRRFLWDRFLRTYPLFIALIVVGACTNPNAVSLERVLHTMLGLASFTFNGLQLTPYSGMFWTIGVEWQFYLLFPLLLAFIRQKPVWHVLALLALAFACRGVAYLNGADFRDLGYWTILGRLDQFIVGIAAGLSFRKLSPTLKRWLFLPALACALGSLFWLNRLGGWPVSTPFKTVWPLWEGVMWAALVVSYVSVANFVPRVIARSMRFVGTVSYSIYLWHFPILSVVAAKRWTLPLLANSQQNACLNTVLFALPVIIAFSALSYYVIERPFLQLRVRYLVASSNPTAATT